MNILHVTRAEGENYKYGIQKSLVPLIEDLRIQGHMVESANQDIIISMQLKSWELWIIKKYLKYMKGKFKEEGINAWFVLRERVEICIRVAKLAKLKKITHVHCHDALFGYMYDFFRKIYNSTPNWGITEHAYGRFIKVRLGVETSGKSLKVLQKQELIATNKAKWIIFPTKSGMNTFLEDMKIAKPSKKWYVVPHVVEVNLTDRELAREKQGIAPNEKLLIAVGSLFPMKRFDLLLNALKHVPQNLLHKVIILGGGPQREHLFLLSKKFKLQQHLQIIETTDISEYLSAADIYVSTSSTESFGIANCEALLAGVPSVCTAVDAVPEVISNAAILVNDDPENIAEAIRKILVSEKLQNKLRSRAANVVKGWWARRQLSNKMIDIYSRC